MQPTPFPPGLRPLAERRRSPRHSRRVRVLIMPEDCALEEPYGGWIANVSSNGVCLTIQREIIPIGTILRIRASSGLSSGPWVTVRVRHGRRNGNDWEMGCEIVRSPALKAGQVQRAAS